MRPAFDPEGSATAALEQYDANKDGGIDKKEAGKSPGFAKAFARIDQDGDGKATQAEIAQRIVYYKSAATTIVSGATEITWKGAPLMGASVTFEPEGFLGEQFVPCSGETDEYGVANVTGHDSGFPGIYLGFYRVRISKVVNGKETIPAKYNTETTLGHEAADDIPMVASLIKFELK